MKITAKKKKIISKNDNAIRLKKPVLAPKKKIRKSAPELVLRSKPLTKIADKIRGKVLNIKAVEASSIVAAGGKALPKSDVKAPEFEVKKTKIRVVGVGGGGSNIVSEIADRVKKSSFVIANTDAAALRRASKNVSVFQFGESLTRGLGTGMEPRIAEEAAAQDKERIKKIMEGQDLVIIVASLGGGTGSGAVPVFAQISKSLGNLTYGIFTLPFKFEGEKKNEIAKTALEKSKPYLNALTILPNERVFEVVPKATPFAKTLSYINNALSDSLEGLIETIYRIGVINIDFADLRAILVGGGKMAFLNTVSLKKGEEAGAEVFERVFSSPLYPYGIDKAKGLLLNIVAQRDLKLSEINRILTGAARRIHKDARIIFGVGNEGASENTIKVSALATGCVYAGMSNGDDNNGDRHAKLPPAPKRPAPLPAPNKSTLKPLAKKKTLNSALNEKLLAKKGKAAKPAPAKTAKKIAIKIRDSAIPTIEKSALLLEAKNGLQDYQAGKNIDAQFEAPARKNALQVKKEIELEEQKMLDEEKAWDVPAFLRKQKK